jgi:HTH DNA binding domain
MRAITRELRNAKNATVQPIALIEAFEQSSLIGLKEHDRLIVAREQMLRKFRGKRTNSKLPALIELVLGRSLVTSTMIERELKVAMQGSLNLVAELALREVTGRGRYRAWAVI